MLPKITPNPQTHLKTHYWTLHCTPERRSPVPPTRTLMQVCLARKPWQANCPTPHTGRNLQNKKEPQTTRIQKAHPQNNNLNKMKRHRNTQKVKEHEKCPPSQTKEKKIRNLFEKEFRIMIKIIQNLEKKCGYRWKAWRQELRRCKKCLTRT